MIMFRDFGYCLLMIILLIIEFPIVLVIYFILSIMYCIYSILEFILRPFKILFEKLFM